MPASPPRDVTSEACRCSRTGADPSAVDLHEVARDDVNWETLLRCRCDQFWLQTWPHSAQHGGGLPRYRRMDAVEATRWQDDLAARVAGAWQVADAWILLAIGCGSQDEWRTLPEVLDAADAINHDVPSQHEVGRAYGRLRASGLIEIDGGSARPCADGRRLLHTTRGGAPQSWLHRVALALTALPVPGGAAANVPTPKDYRTALATHLGR